MAKRTCCASLNLHAGCGYHTFFATHGNVGELTATIRGCIFDAITRDRVSNTRVAFGRPEVLRVFDHIMAPGTAGIRLKLGNAWPLPEKRDAPPSKHVAGSKRVASAGVVPATPTAR